MRRKHATLAPALLRKALLAMALALPVSPGMADQSLGTLFFTPQQRRDLDKRSPATVAEPAAAPLLNGYILRSSGRHTLWLDGVAHERNAPGPLELTPGKPLPVPLPQARKGSRDAQ